MIVRVTAGWIVPIVAPVVRDGWLDVETTRGEVVGLGPRRTPSPRPADQTLDLPGAVILPGLVNAHTHLELAHLAGQVPPAASFVTWVRALLRVRFGAPAAPQQVHDAAVAAIGALEAAGTVAVGDIGNTAAAVQPLSASSLHGVWFREALGFKTSDAARVIAETYTAAEQCQAHLRVAGNRRLAASVAPHAPYSSSAPLIAGLAGGYRPSGRGASIHLAESAEEVAFLSSGQGPFRALLEELGSWDAAWVPPATGPVRYLQQLGALGRDLLVVHGTQCTREDLQVLAEVGATLVLCARSNRWVGAGDPPVAAAVEAGVRLAVGTDSLASVSDLNVFAELAALRALAPQVAAAPLLRAATLGGAEALGCRSLGYLGAGACSRALVRVPPADVADVEEWLVGGASDTTDLRWLDTLTTHVASTAAGAHA